MNHATLTDDDVRVLEGIGKAALTNVQGTTVYVLFFGMLMVLFGVSVNLALRRGLYNKLAAYIFWLTVLSFILFGLHTGGQIARTIIQLRKALVEDFGTTLTYGLGQFYDANTTTHLIAFWSINFIRLINLFVILWRAWALWQAQKWALVLPFLLWLATVAISLADTILVSTSWGLDSYRDGAYEDTFFFTTVILSVTTNGMITLLIAFKLWQHRSFVAQAFKAARRKTAIRQVWVLLFETGFVYLVLQITFMAVNFNQYEINNPVAIYAYEDIYFAITALLPTIMMLIFQRGHSIAHVYNFDTSIGRPEEARSPSEAASYELPKLQLSQLHLA